MHSIHLTHLRDVAHTFLLEADRPQSVSRLAGRLFGPGRQELPEAHAVVRTLLLGDGRFVETHDRRWSARLAPYIRRRLEDTSFAVVDLETTGSMIGVDQIIEVGVVMVRGGKPVDRFSTLVRAQRRVPRWVAQLTGIRANDLRRAPAFRELIPTLSSLLEDTVFVAHDVLFDLPFLRWEYAKRNLPMPAVTGMCTLRLSRQLWPDLTSRSLPELARHFQVPHRNPHRAGQDAQATAGVLVEALGRAQELGFDHVGDLFSAGNGRPSALGDPAPPLAAGAAE